MPMVVTTLQTALTTIFNSMNSISQDGDTYCAKEMAEAIKTFILTGQVATVDTGAAPAGSYAGDGVGTMTIDANALSEDLLTTFDACYANNDLAEHIATDIDNACKENNIVKTTSTGMVTTPSGSTSAFSGPGEGNFTGTKSTIATALKACYTTMNNMTSGGNEYYSAQFAAAVYAYLLAGSISVTLKSPFTSGSGYGELI